MAPRRISIRTASSVLSIALVILIIVQLLVCHLGRYEDDDDGSSHRRSSSLHRRNLFGGLASPFIGARSDKNQYDYSVIIISYHKTGVSFSVVFHVCIWFAAKLSMHVLWIIFISSTRSPLIPQHDLQMDLIDFITGQFSGMGPALTKYGNKSPLKRRRHPPKTPCSRIHLQTGTISVQHAWVYRYCRLILLFYWDLLRIANLWTNAFSCTLLYYRPDLFCTPEELAHILLEGGDGHKNRERGVKIVHLVRNPFSMAVSNYHYHAQLPTWV